MQKEKFVKPIPSVRNAFKTLLKADFIIQWRQRRAFIMSIIVPVLFIVSWKSLIPEIGGAAVLAICISVGLPAMGLMGYSISIARDRERGIFQRLRAAPIPTWVIMSSRILVQMVMMAVMSLVTCAFAYFVDGIVVPPLSLVLVVIASVIGGLSFLALGQFVVAFIQGSEAVNSATRLIYFPLAIIGALGEVGLFGEITQKIVTWSPLGTTKILLVAALIPSTINAHVFNALLVTLGYGLFFAGIGIGKFRWTGK